MDIKELEKYNKDLEAYFTWDYDEGGYLVIIDRDGMKDLITDEVMEEAMQK